MNDDMKNLEQRNERCFCKDFYAFFDEDVFENAHRYDLLHIRLVAKTHTDSACVCNGELALRKSFGRDYLRRDKANRHG